MPELPCWWEGGLLWVQLPLLVWPLLAHQVPVHCCLATRAVQAAKRVLSEPADLHGRGNTISVQRSAETVTTAQSCAWHVLKDGLN